MMASFVRHDPTCKAKCYLYLFHQNYETQSNRLRESILIYSHSYDQMHSFKDKQEDMDVSPKSEFARLESVG